VSRRIEPSKSVAGMKMFRWMSGVTTEDRIRYEYVRSSIGEASIVETRENRLRLFGNMMRRMETKAIRMVMKMNIEKKREREKSKKKWLDTTENDMRAAGVCVGDVEDRDKWSSRTRVTDHKWLGRR